MLATASRKTAELRPRPTAYQKRSSDWMSFTSWTCNDRGLVWGIEWSRIESPGFYSPTKYVIPKSLKVSHWPNKPNHGVHDVEIQKLQYFTKLDFPEIRGFPVQKAPFLGKIGRVTSRANLTRIIMARFPILIRFWSILRGLLFEGSINVVWR